MRRTGLLVAICVLATGLLGACANAPDSGGSGGGASPGAGSHTAPDGAGPAPADEPVTPATAQQLVGTWVVDAIFDAPNQPFLTIREDGSWAGSDGCNGVRGTWAVGGDGALTVEAGPSTLIACDGKPLPTLFANARSASVATLDGSETVTLVDAAGPTTMLVAGREDLTPIAPPAS
ncbi:META domain-containing protein [Glaciibacter sp. 2TAF33]|uniref:META domain-containing protein n=1 Tax=Glaciibacter sp. 2TAF33 TaxID=3233015 RepID=UPI003F90F9CC